MVDLARKYAARLAGAKDGGPVVLDVGTDASRCGPQADADIVQGGHRSDDVRVIPAGDVPGRQPDGVECPADGYVAVSAESA